MLRVAKKRNNFQKNVKKSLTKGLKYGILYVESKNKEKRERNLFFGEIFYETY